MAETMNSLEFLQTLKPTDELNDNEVLLALMEKEKEKGSANSRFWNRAEYDPVTVDPSTFKKSGLSFTILTYPTLETLPDNLTGVLVDYVRFLTNKGFIYRHSLVGDKPINRDIVKAANGRCTVYSFLNKLIPKDMNNAAAHSEMSLGMAAGIHGKFKSLPPAIRFTHSCIIQTILGAELDNPIDLMLIYTACGNIDFDYEDKNLRSTFGFIGNFVNFARKDCGLQVFNIKGLNCKENLKQYVNMILEKQKSEATAEDDAF